LGSQKASRLRARPAQGDATLIVGAFSSSSCPRWEHLPSVRGSLRAVEHSSQGSTAADFAPRLQSGDTLPYRMAAGNLPWSRPLEPDTIGRVPILSPLSLDFGLAHSHTHVSVFHESLTATMRQTLCALMKPCLAPKIRQKGRVCCLSTRLPILLRNLLTSGVLRERVFTRVSFVRDTTNTGFPFKGSRSLLIEGTFERGCFTGPENLRSNLKHTPGGAHVSYQLRFHGGWRGFDREC